MSKRLETLRNKLEAVEAERAAAKSELLEIVERDGDPTEDEATQTRSLVTKFEELGPQADALAEEIRSLEAVLNAPERARVAGAPTVLIRQANPLDDENVQYGPIDQVRGAAKTAIERVAQTSDTCASR